jgi:spore maturation protein CgeB
LVANGIYVHVFGDGWEYLQKEYPEHLIIHERVSYKQSVLLMQDTKISLNVMPWFKSGFHDRIATAALNGCVSVTDRSTYTQTNYVDGEDIIYYDLKELDALPEKVNHLLHHEQEAEQIAQNAYNIALAKDTWKQRAEWLLNMKLTKEAKGKAEEN